MDRAAPPQLRAAATRRLAVLAGAADAAGRPLVPAADPSSWWGVREPTHAPEAVRPADEPVALSGSQLTALGRCPLRWFLGHEARGDVAHTTALGFGSLVHALADGVARAEVPARLDALEQLLAPVWPELGYEAQWQAAAESADASAALAAFLRWHGGRSGRTLVASEHDFDLEVPAGEDRVRLRGSFDRVEVDDGGQVHVVDLKTQQEPSPRVPSSPCTPSSASTSSPPRRVPWTRCPTRSAPAPGSRPPAPRRRSPAPSSCSCGPAPAPATRRSRDRHRSRRATTGSPNGCRRQLPSCAVRRSTRCAAASAAPAPFRSLCPADDEGGQVLP